MRLLLGLGFFVLFFVRLSSQEITEDFIDSLYEHNSLSVLEFDAVRTINYGLKLIDKLDTISYSRAGWELAYSYKGEAVNDPFNWTEIDKPIRIRFGYGHGSRTSTICFLKKRNDTFKQETLVEVRTSYLGNSRVILKNVVKGLLDERYLELTLYGKTLVDGNYTQIDSTWQDTVAYINPITYELTDSLILRNEFSLKTGKWIFCNEQGDTIKIENYPEID